MTADSPVLTVAEYAALYRCSTNTVRRAIAAGEIPVVRLRGVVRIPRIVAFAPLTNPHTPEPASAAGSQGSAAKVEPAAHGGPGPLVASGGEAAGVRTGPRLSVDAPVLHPRGQGEARCPD